MANTTGWAVIEVQTDFDGTVSALHYTYAEKDEAENKYHSVLAYAALNNTKRYHSATLLTNLGEYIESKCFEHDQQ